MAATKDNRDAIEWEEHASLLVAGALYNKEASQELKKPTYTKIRIWNILLLLALLGLLIPAGFWLYEAQTGKAPLSSVNLAGAKNPGQAAQYADLGSMDFWKVYFSGFKGMGRWLAVSLLVSQLYVSRLVNKAFNRVVRLWRFTMKSSSEANRARSWFVPAISSSDKEAMLTTTFWGFWLQANRGVKLSPFGLRIFVTVFIAAAYAALVYTDLVNAPLG